ncbi:MAG: hypothetical protein JKY48_19095 [Flavobacteriales bacterium]|nr:hypothetical protein [Flavobacteriales bacterium]
MFKTLYPFLICLLFFSCSNPPSKEENTKEEKEYRRTVGDIVFDPTIDSSPTGFSPCNANYSYQYYKFESNGIKYKGEKPQLVKEILDAYSPPEENLQSGYITIRFVVNCKVKSGYFRMKQIDTDYKPKEFSSAVGDQLKKIISNLRGWETKSSSKGRVYDYHQYLTFKIVDNQIKSIVP